MAARMTSLDEFYDWFRTEAQSLPPEIKTTVLEALDVHDHRNTFLKLESLQKSGALPSRWDEVLSSFYSRFF